MNSSPSFQPLRPIRAAMANRSRRSPHSTINNRPQGPGSLRAPRSRRRGGERPQDDALSPKLAPLKVLVMEDDAVLGLILGEVLAGMGYVCAIEATEEDAVASADRCRPQLMIVDVRLAEGSGIAAVDRILSAGAVPHVFVSGDLSGLQVLRPKAVAIRKPFRETDLVLAIQRAFDLAAVPA